MDKRPAVREAWLSSFLLLVRLSAYFHESLGFRSDAENMVKQRLIEVVGPEIVPASDTVP